MRATSRLDCPAKGQPRKVFMGFFFGRSEQREDQALKWRMISRGLETELKAAHMETHMPTPIQLD